MSALYEIFLEIIKKGRGDEVASSLGLSKHGNKTIELLSATKTEDCHKIRKEASPGSKLERLATARVQQILFYNCQEAATVNQCRSIHDDPFSDEETKLEAFKRMISFMSLPKIRKEIAEGVYSNSHVYQYLAIERHEEMILVLLSYADSVQECMELFKQAFKKSTKKRMFKKCNTFRKIKNSIDGI